ncbi:MAG: hypothetical protein M3T56_04525 [Chloroflexota bacterium]|nr:hypothetical protein [Chloroflexota bacterium]
MTTSLAHDARHDDWAETRAVPGGDSIWTRAQPLLWTLLSLGLLGAFLLFVVDDYPLRSLIAVR